jgi:Viral BACON domain
MTLGEKWGSIYWNPSENLVFRDIANDGQRFVAIGDAFLCWTSSDGLAWTGRPKTPTAHFGIAYGNNRFVAVGFRGSLIVSPDGNEWQSKDSGVTSNFNKITYAPDKNWFVAVSSDGQISVSTNGGATFSGSQAAGSGLNDIAYGNQLFVATSGDGRIYTSSNAKQWTVRKIGIYHLLPSICDPQSGTFVVAGKNGYIYSSNNGINWDLRKIVDGAYFIGGGWTGQLFVLVGEVLKGVAVMYTSPNGIHWTRRSSHSKSAILTIDAMPEVKRVIGMGSWSSIIVSDNDTQTIKITNPYQLKNPKEKLSFPPGDPIDITWKASAGITNVRIQFSKAGGGGPYNTIAKNVVASEGKYSFILPDIDATNCVFRISQLDGSSLVMSAPFEIGEITGKGGLTLTHPNGGEWLNPGSDYIIKWQSTNINDKIRIRCSYNNGNDWQIIADNQRNDGSYKWNVPTNVSSSWCLVRINAINRDGEPFDFSDHPFKIKDSIAITLTSPNGGEALTAGDIHTITWTTQGTVNNVDIRYTLDGGANWNPLATSVPDSGQLDWQVPFEPTASCRIHLKAWGSIHHSEDLSDGFFSILEPSQAPPHIELSHRQLIFVAHQEDALPSTQQVTITNSGGQSLAWEAVANVDWMAVSPTSGSDGTSLDVAVEPRTLAVGNHRGAVSINDPLAQNSPQSFVVNLNIKASLKDSFPFGAVLTPRDLTVMGGAVAITGWALDEVAVKSVKLYRLVKEDFIFIGEAAFIEGVMPDIGALYPDYPHHSRAAWVYTLLSNHLPDGETVIKVIAQDVSGKEIVLGSWSLAISNKNAILPFGAIDSPAPGGTVSGSAFRINGWVLASKSNKIPIDGSSIKVYIDGVSIGHAHYNLHRKDIARIFPGYLNSEGAWAYYDFDSTAFSNGIHTLHWQVTDEANNTQGIGSRYFVINNPNPRNFRSKYVPGTDTNTVLTDYTQPIAVRIGYADHIPPHWVYSGADGAVRINLPQMSRVVIFLDLQLPDQSPQNRNSSTGKQYKGYREVSGELQSLPIGSRLDENQGIYFMQPGPGLVGLVKLVFFITGKDQTLKKTIILDIEADYY